MFINSFDDFNNFNVKTHQKINNDRKILMNKNLTTMENLIASNEKI